MPGCRRQDAFVVGGRETCSEPVHVLFADLSVTLTATCSRRRASAPRRSTHRDVELERDGGPPSSIRHCGRRQAEVKGRVRGALPAIVSEGLKSNKARCAPLK